MKQDMVSRDRKKRRGTVEIVAQECKIGVKKSDRFGQ